MRPLGMKMDDIIAHLANEPAQPRNAAHIEIIAHDDRTGLYVETMAARKE
jgi:hypothetical protein